MRSFILIAFAAFLFSFIARADEYDCTNFKPFEPIEIIKADVTISRFFKVDSNGSGMPVEEEICKSTSPLEIPVKDIRGREADWYYCDKPQLMSLLICEANYKGEIAKIYVKPVMVIRHWQPGDALDTNMHVNLLPADDPSRALDTFTQALGFDLSVREITLNGSAGGRGPNADQDYYYVRAKYYK